MRIGLLAAIIRWWRSCVLAAGTTKRCLLGGTISRRAEKGNPSRCIRLFLSFLSFAGRPCTRNSVFWSVFLVSILFVATSTHYLVGR